MLEAMLEHSRKQHHGSENEVQYVIKWMVEGRKTQNELWCFESYFVVSHT